MDLQKHTVLATRFATVALVFSVSACVLSRSMTENEQVKSDKTTTDSAQKSEPQKNDGKALADKSKAGEQAATTQTQKANVDGKTHGKVTSAKASAAKPNPIRKTNQKVAKLANSGKLNRGSTPQQEQRVVRKQLKPTIQNYDARKVIRYVSVETLNVRMHASTDAPVVGKLTKGTMYHVVIDGAWARISDNQYVMTKYLSSQQPRYPSNTWTYRK